MFGVMHVSGSMELLLVLSLHDPHACNRGARMFSTHLKPSLAAKFAENGERMDFQ
jgi:hypothetical protein